MTDRVPDPPLPPAPPPPRALSQPEPPPADVSNHLEELDELIMNRVELGLFAADADKAGELLHLLDAARRSVHAGEYDNAISYMSALEVTLSVATYRKRLWWRVFRLHQLHILIYYLAALLVFLNILTGWFSFVSTTISVVPVAAFCFGGMGAVLRGLSFLYQQISLGIYRPPFLFAHLAAPWIGGLFGLSCYLFLRAGLIAMEGGGSGGRNASAVQYAVAFLAGFNWEWIAARLDSFARRGTARNDGTPPTGSTGSAQQTGDA